VLNFLFHTQLPCEIHQRLLFSALRPNIKCLMSFLAFMHKTGLSEQQSVAAEKDLLRRVVEAGAMKGESDLDPVRLVRAFQKEPSARKWLERIALEHREEIMKHKFDGLQKKISKRQNSK
jgi:hypothetical protein